MQKGPPKLCSSFPPHPWIDHPAVDKAPTASKGQPALMIGNLAGLTVTYLYAGGSGYGSATPEWASAEYVVRLERADRSPEPFRYGSDVHAGAAAAMFSLLTLALQTGRPVDIAYLEPPPGNTRVLLSVALSA